MEKGDLHFDSKIYFNIFVWRLNINYMYLARERERNFVCLLFFFSRFRLYYDNVTDNNLHLLGSRKQSRQTGGMGVSCVSGILLSLETEGGSSVGTGSVDS